MGHGLTGAQGGKQGQGVARKGKVEGEGQVDLVDIPGADIARQLLESAAVGPCVHPRGETRHRRRGGDAGEQRVGLGSGQHLRGLEQPEGQQRPGPPAGPGKEPAFEGSVQLIGEVSRGVAPGIHLPRQGLQHGIHGLDGVAGEDPARVAEQPCPAPARPPVVQQDKGPGPQGLEQVAGFGRGLRRQGRVRGHGPALSGPLPGDNRCVGVRPGHRCRTANPRQKTP